MKTHQSAPSTNAYNEAGKSSRQAAPDGATYATEWSEVQIPSQTALAESVGDSPRQASQLARMADIHASPLMQSRHREARSLQLKAAPRLTSFTQGSHAASPVTQLAGAYEGRMPMHDTFGDSYTMNGSTKREFTYHHIIPENKIKKVLLKVAEVVDKDDQVKTLKDGIATHASAQFDETMATDTAYFVTKALEIYKTSPAITLLPAEARKIIKEPFGNRTELIDKFKVLLANKLEQLPETDSEVVLTERRDLAEKLKDKSFEELVAKYAISGIEDKFTEGAIWMPGNIHRGPKGTFRLSPENKTQFDEWRDDGGDSFEKAAANVVTVDHFKKLWDLNAEMDKLIAMKTPQAEEEEMDAFREQVVKVLTGMDGIRKIDTTPFNPEQWETGTHKAGKGIKAEYMRLKEHVPGEHGEKRLEEAKKLR